MFGLVSQVCFCCAEQKCGCRLGPGFLGASPPPGRVQRHLPENETKQLAQHTLCKMIWVWMLKTRACAASKEPKGCSPDLHTSHLRQQAAGCTVGGCGHGEEVGRGRKDRATIYKSELQPCRELVQECAKGGGSVGGWKEPVAKPPAEL